MTNLITTTTLAPEVYVKARDAQEKIRRSFALNMSGGDMTPSFVHEFEDSINSLSGEILNLPQEQLEFIQNENTDIVKTGIGLGYIIQLYKSMVNHVSDETTVENKTAKKLYPLTISVPYSQVIHGSEQYTSNIEDIIEDSFTVTTITEQEDVIDPVFAEMDAEKIEDAEPLATIQTKTTVYLPDEVLTMGLEAASYDSLEDGLITLSHNPLDNLISGAVATISYYTENNFANLDIVLSSISSNVNLAIEYETYKNVLGGADGLSGCVSQLNVFREHTDRLSGIKLDSESPEYENDHDSSHEYLNLSDYSAGSHTLISFEASKYRSAKYLIQASANATTGHQLTEIHVLHDNQQAYISNTSPLYSVALFCTYSVQLNDSNVEILVSTTADNTYFVISGTKLKIASQANAYDEISQTKIIQNHDILSAYLDDGVDYIVAQSGSIQNGYLIANLARDFVDSVAILSGTEWQSLSLLNKQSSILDFADMLKVRRKEIQDSIDNDYSNFKAYRRKAEALDIGYNLTIAYTGKSSNTIPELTLNNETKTAINHGYERQSEE